MKFVGAIWNGWPRIKRMIASPLPDPVPGYGLNYGRFYG